jgi:hypothetical protein
MPINVPNSGAYQQQLGQHVTQFRDALQQLLNDAAYLQSMGGSAFLQAAPFNMSQVDADKIMATVGAVTPQNSVVSSLQAWIATTQPLWGGQ